MDSRFKELLAVIEKELAALPLSEQPSNLYDPIKYTLGLGGKRIRPVFTLLGCELFETHYSSAIPQALAIEIFHNFTLVHDDIMDSAELRRSLPTVHKKWNPNVAILSGDAMLVLAYQQLLQTPASILPQVMSVFNRTALDVCEGQQMDMDIPHSAHVTLEDYLLMIRLKTAALLSGAIQIGGIIGGADNTQLAHLAVFAETTGIAFQVRDDYLDTFGGQEFGKSTGGDIREGKQTWLTVKSLEISDKPTKERMYAAYANHDLSARVEQVIEIYRDLGIHTKAEEMVNEYSAKALNALDAIDGNKDTKATLKQLVSFLMGRNV